MKRADVMAKNYTRYRPFHVPPNTVTRFIEFLFQQPWGATTKELLLCGTDHIVCCAPHSVAAEARANGFEIPVVRKRINGVMCYTYYLSAGDVKHRQRMRALAGQELNERRSEPTEADEEAKQLMDQQISEMKQINVFD